jgi:uncharacterized membrane protein YjjB (DUF3815 family)
MSYLHDKDWIAEIGLLSPNGIVIATLLRKEFHNKYEADLEISISSVTLSCYGNITTRVYNKKEPTNNLIFWPR